MAVCTWCAQEMTTVNSCTIDAFHVDGRPVEMIPTGPSRAVMPFVFAVATAESHAAVTTIRAATCSGALCAAAR